VIDPSLSTDPVTVVIDIPLTGNGNGPCRRVNITAYIIVIGPRHERLDSLDLTRNAEKTLQHSYSIIIGHALHVAYRDCTRALSV
jgi:hypothetical protein